ncbi:hypothetical protein DI09_5p190 [Mitosporidium daphniae]|uniref:S1 motif domain-containing protein n=1 Tax=Mitosporidium daphniae TaxID=1485682 RepID=A0A098VNL6_9MICR|nr:uncharacterized protein DI09_5p190 [Mitosporidium daphniae]KGG50672.1 hypothetical protein DI09_5p190 [Mitosporidium daphniae]|eukprot:XP_013237099.1 uncharacterized protein DI09_5p190 [Mitosporidium daphniae]
MQQMELTHRVSISPEFFGPGLMEEVQRRLRTEHPNCVINPYHLPSPSPLGYIVAVLSITSISRGVLVPTFGHADFDISYRAIVLKPFKGEVVDAIVASVTKMGFFAETGPLQIFVSAHLIPPDLSFDANSLPACFISEDQSQRISPEDLIRLKIVGLKLDATEIFAIGTIKEDYLGWIG